MAIVVGCEFPDEYYYDVENDVWVFRVSEKVYRLGATMPFFYKIGRPTKIKPKPVGSHVKRGQSIASIETSRYVGVIYSPIDGEVVNINQNLERIVEDPYKDGWITEIETEQEIDNRLKRGEEAVREYEKKLAEENIVCFKTYPDHRLTVLAKTCEQILTQVGDYFFKFVKKGETLYVITQDPATEVDMIKWAQDMKQELVELHRQGSLIHVLYRRV